MARRIVTAREQYEMLAPWRTAAEDYRIQHQAPASVEEGAPMHDLSGTYPDDFYSRPNDYADGQPYDAESIDAMHSARGRPNRMIDIYRTLPLGSDSGGSGSKYPLNTGDWVTPSLAYAKEHGQNNMGNEPWTILKHKVPAAHLFTDGNSINEWGYGGPNTIVRQHPWARARQRKEEIKNTPVTPEMMQGYVRNYFRNDDDDANTELANRGWDEFNRRVDSGEFKPTYDATPKNKFEQYPGTDHIYDMFADIYTQRNTGTPHTAMSDIYDEYAGHHQAPGPGSGFPIHQMEADSAEPRPTGPWLLESIASFQKDASMVTVYTKPDCPQCTMTRRRLEHHGIPHQVIDVTQDPEAYAHVTQNLGYQQAPVVVAGDDHWSGFRPDRIKALLG